MFNLEFVIPAILSGIIGGFNFNFQELKNDPGRWFSVWFWTGLTFTILTGLVFWLAQPGIYAPYQNIFWVLIILWGINLFIVGVRTDSVPALGAAIYALLIFAFIAGACSGSAIFRHSDYRSLIGEVKKGNWTEDMAPVDEAHMRIVSKKQAQYLADKVLGESKDILGSRYKVGEVNVSNVNGEIVWAAPLEFRGFWKWNKFKSTPGYVLVSAEDNNQKPVLVDTMDMKYLPSAYWDRYLKRHIYTNGYQDYKLREISFELDDSYKPYFVISATRPTIAFYGHKTEGVIIVDPTDGSIEWQSMGEIDPWIDRVVPEELAESYITAWGKYVKGFWNTMFAQEDMIGPTPYTYGSDVWFVPNAEGRNFWYTGITSVSSEDQSLVGVVLMDTRTGEAFMYRQSGSNEQAVVDAVTQRLGAEAQNWEPTQPIPYNIYGELSFDIPVVGKDKPILQRVALVRATNLNVALGKDKRSALRQYRRLLSSNGNMVAPTHESSLKSITGEITRKGSELQDNVTIFYILLSSAPDKLFTVTSETSPEVVIASQRDEVTISFMETEEAVVNAYDFDLHGVELRKSKVQDAYEAEVKENQEQLRDIEETREAKRNLENLSPEELKELYNLQKERGEE